MNNTVRPGQEETLVTKRTFAKLRPRYTWVITTPGDEKNPVFIQVSRNQLTRMFRNLPDAWFFAKLQTDLFKGPHAVITYISHQYPALISGYIIV